MHASTSDPASGSPVLVRRDWSGEEVRALHDLPRLELICRAQTVHRSVFGDNKVQLCSLLSIKTGGCAEDCAYCPQARDAGATRFCMGAAWREVKDGPQFDEVLERVRGVRGLGLEACAIWCRCRLRVTLANEMPFSMVRLSAGRLQMSEEAQLLCMLAGANSLFFGEKLLTTGNPEYGPDMALLDKAGVLPLRPELAR